MGLILSCKKRIGHCLHVKYTVTYSNQINWPFNTVTVMTTGIGHYMHVKYAVPNRINLPVDTLTVMTTGVRLTHHHCKCKKGHHILTRTITHIQRLDISKWYFFFLFYSFAVRLQVKQKFATNRILMRDCLNKRPNFHASNVLF